MKASLHIVQIQACTCTNYGPQRLGETTIGETIFTYLCILERIFCIKHLANFNQTWYKPFLWKEFKFLQMEGQVLFKGRGVNHKSSKHRTEPEVFKYCLMTYRSRKAQIYMRTSHQFYLIHGPPGMMRDHNRVKHIYFCFNGKNLWKFSFQETTDLQKVKIYLQDDLMQNQVVKVMALKRLGSQ
jgi:hypothetical protein